MIQYDYGHENLQGFLAEIANNAAKQKDAENSMQKWER